jgi:hypothetical protein
MKFSFPNISVLHVDAEPNPMAVRSKAWVCRRSQAGIASLNSAGEGGHGFVVIFVWCQVEVSSRGALPCVVCPVSVTAQPRNGRPCHGTGSKRNNRKEKRLMNIMENEKQTIKSGTLLVRSDFV